MRFLDWILAIVGPSTGTDKPDPSARRLTGDEIRAELVRDRHRSRGWVHAWKAEERRPSPIVRVPWR